MRFSNVFLLDLPKCLWSVSQCLTTRVFGPWYWSRSNYWVAIVPPDGQSSGYECRKRYDYLLLTLNSLKLLKSESGSHLWLCNTMMPNNVLSMFPQYFQHSEPGRKNEEPMDYGVIVKKRHQWTSVKNDTIYMFYLHLPWYKFYRKYMLTKKNGPGWTAVRTHKGDFLPRGVVGHLWWLPAKGSCRSTPI